MPISIKDASGNSVAMTNAQRLQLLSDLGAAELSAVNASLATKQNSATTVVALSADRALTSADHRANLAITANRSMTVGVGGIEPHFINSSNAPVTLTIQGTSGVIINGTANGSVTRTIPARGTLTLRADADGSYDVPEPGSGSVAVQDEGTQVSASASAINFRGAGVTASAGAGGAVNVDIPGAGEASPFSQQAHFTDSFTRSDTSAGYIGGSWSLLGLNALAPATNGYITGRKFTADAGSVVYATQDIKRPVNWIGARVGWFADSGGAGQTTAAFLISPVGGAPGIIADAALHITLTRTALAIGYIKSQVITNARSITLPRTIPIGEEITCDFYIDGNYVYFSVDGTVGRHKMPMASAIGLGQYATWEIYHASAANADRVYFASTWAGFRQPSAQNLRDLCVAAWNFETTGWTDSSGQSVTLTGNGSPTVAAGKHGNALSLASASSQYLSLATSVNQVELGGKDWTVVMWVNPTTLPSSGQFMSLFNKGSTATLELDVFVDSAGKVNAVVSPTGSTSSGSVTAITTDTLTAGSWSMVMISYTTSDTRLRVSINNGTKVSQVAAGVFKGASLFRIGYASRLGSSYFNGLIDSYAIFSSPPGHGGSLENELLSYLYYDGAGKAWPF